MMSWGRVRLDPRSQAKLTHLLSDPRRRAQASRMLNEQSQLLKRDAERIADAELHERPPDRRSKIAQSHGATVARSFEIVPAHEIGPDKLRVAIRNTHPAFPIIEKGSAPHEIVAHNKRLRFPYGGRTAPGGANRKGSFAVAFGDAPTVYPQRVSHPGTKAHNIMRRVLDRYRRTAGPVINR